MANPAVLVHRIVVHFESGATWSILGDHVTTLNVNKRKLTVAPRPSPAPPDELVTQVEFEYRAEDGVEYRTVVRAGDVDDAEAADHIKFGPGKALGGGRPPQVMRAREIRPGKTFAVADHQTTRQSAMSKALQGGWHRSDCTWFYPY